MICVVWTCILCCCAVGTLCLVQENVYQDERPFLSARRVMYEMGEPYRSGVEIVSFHTVSKVSTVQWQEGAIHAEALQCFTS